MLNDLNLDLVNINAYPKFGQIPSIRSQYIEILALGLLRD